MKPERTADGPRETEGRAPVDQVVVEGNRLELWPDGPRILAGLLEMIDGAEQSLRLLYYIFSPDGSGHQVRDALIRAAERGVAVSLLVDDFGSGKADEAFFKPLRDAGARVCRFHPSIGRRYLLRNHQKLVLADDRKALIGGFNVEDSYFGTPERGAWRDLGLLVDGDASARLASYFDAIYDWATSGRSRMRALRRIIHRHTETGGTLQWQFGGPTRNLSPWGLSSCRDMARAKRLGMIAAYFSPTFAMRRRIGAIARRGQAQVITAARSDNNATIAAARSTYAGLLKRRVELFEYQATKLHTKLLLLDNVAHVGSANFDIRSLYLNLELMLRVDDPAFAAMCWRYFERERADSLAITRELHTRRATLFNRIKWALSFFLVTSMDYTVTRRLNFVEE